MSTSQNGWPVIPDYGDPALKALPQISGSVAKGDPWTIFDWLCRQFAASVEPIKKGDSWGYANRTIRGSTVISNHASGTAIDLNATDHPLAAVGTFTAAKVKAIRAILAQTAIDGAEVVRWGGDYPSRKDEMHFELRPGHATPARVHQLAAKLTGATVRREVAPVQVQPVTTEQRQSEAWTHRVVNAEWLNVRTGPSTDYRALTAVKRGTPVRLAGGGVGNWVRVDVKVPYGKGFVTGWVNHDYISQ